MFKKMNLAMKIGLGFGVVIILLMIISIVAWNGLSSGSDGFTSYRALARDTNLAGRLQANMLMTRMNVKDFLLTQNEKDIEEYKHYHEQMTSFLKEAHEEIQNPERAALIDTYTEEVAVYDTAYHKVIDLYKERHRLQTEILNVIGPRMEKDLTSIMESAAADNEGEAALQAGIAIRALMLGRLYAMKYLDTNHVEDKERVEKEFAEVLEASEHLKSLLQNPKRRKLNDEVMQMSRQYLETFQKQYRTIVARNELIKNTLDTLGPKMAKDIETVKLSVKEEQDILGPVVQAKVHTAERVIIIVSVVALVLAVTASVVITRTITGPILRMENYVNILSSGDFTSKLEITQEDEVGKMAFALDKTVGELGRMIKEIIGGVNTLSSSSTELSAIATQLSGNAEKTSGRAEGVASASEELSTNMSSVSAAMEQSASNIGMVATASEEMSATVNEIAQNAAKAKGISEKAVSQSTNTSRKINELGDVANRIGKVTETITDISEQTNLLALNATIEAARAGEAGKGFAVVANEIKDLAKQTAEATVDIKNQIEGMQATTDTTILDIEKISEVINEINEVITTIATAVEEQSSATAEISNNVAQASMGVLEVNENVAQSSVAVADISKDISTINASAGEVNIGSANVKESATELSRLAEQLNGLVERFKVA